jgi:putative FmdB family regulatory protein
MPTYEYLCQACSHRFEQWQKMIDDPLVTCPECGGHIRRVFFPAGIVFKGSGFYKTDHRSPSAAADANANANANGHSTKGEEAATSATSNESKATSDGKSTTTESSSGSKGTSKGENKAPAATTTATK